MVKRILVGVGFSWAMSVTLGMVFALSSFGKEVLALPAVLPMTLGMSSLIALLFCPLAAWAVRTGLCNLLLYSPVLWGVLTIHIVVGAVVGANHWLPLTQASLFALAVVGTVAIGFIPRHDPQPTGAER